MPTIPVEQIDSRILLVRGQKVLLDRDLARLYGVETKAINQAVKRNPERFPADFMFQLTVAENAALLKSQTVTSNEKTSDKSLNDKDLLRSQIVTSKVNPGSGGRRYCPFAFTEQGVAMLSGLLNSSRAIQVNIEIMRAFVRFRQMLSTHVDLARKLKALEKKYDAQFKVVFEAINELMEPVDEDDAAKEIGFHTIIKPTPSKK
ncbi:MAG: ORF6N domain-containing protein [Verrucomicrobia bacterium]|nr:ORF6N domain-containing protein [Verrucomicrobiota bacterium]